MPFDPLRLLFARTARSEAMRGARASERREAIHRLQVGFSGVGAMILLVGVANIIMNSVKDTQASAVPEAAPTVVASQTPAPARDPLADAGVVPDLPAEPEPEPEAGPAQATPSGAAPEPNPAGNASSSPQP